MKLPNCKSVIISKEKLTDYILSEIHPIGKFKANFFRKFGFDETNVNLFEKAIWKIAKSQQIIEILPSVFGTKYIIDGEIKTPSEKPIKVRTIWIIETNQIRPRFVTIYPV